MNRRGFFRRLGLVVAAVASGVSLTPTIQDRFNRYRILPVAVPTRVFPNDFVLGFKGSTFLETGVVYAPYIPIMVSHPEFIQRYAETTINDKLYSKITICA